MDCLWCGRATGKEPVEHIIPDSLGCPPGLIFTDGEVCARCNNRFSRLDQILIREFDMVRFMAGVPNKKGRQPTIAMRSNTKARYTDGGPYIEINMETHSVRNARGETIGANTRDSRSLAVHVQKVGALGEARVSQEGLCNSRDACRALHKVAFSLFAKQLGMERARGRRFDPVREYVRSGRGNRKVLLAAACQGFSYHNATFQSDGSELDSEVSAFRIAMVCFFVDLSPEQSWLPTLMSKFTGCLRDSWTWVPL